jgi:hypothetical protein
LESKKREERAELALLDKRVEELELQLTKESSPETILVLEKHLAKAVLNVEEFKKSM